MFNLCGIQNKKAPLKEFAILIIGFIFCSCNKKQNEQLINDKNFTSQKILTIPFDTLKVIADLQLRALVKEEHLFSIF